MRYALPLIAVAMLAQSQPPSQAPGKSAQKQQQNGNTENKNAAASQTPSQNAPVVVNFFQSPNSAPTAQQQSEKSNSPAPSDWVVRFTGILALCAIAQVIAMIVQGRYMRKGLEETSKATNAAKQSADALINSERAWVVIDADPRYNPTPAGGTDVRFWIWNTGKTPAKITRTISDAHVLPAGVPFPDIPPYSPGNIGTPYPHILAPGRPDFAATGITGCLVFGIPITGFNLPAIQNGSDSFYMFGRVEYETFGVQKYTTFGFFWKPPSTQNPTPMWDRQKLPPSYNENT